MNPIKHISIYFLNIFFLTTVIFSAPKEIEKISNRKYFPAVLKAIESAEKSIYAAIYYISYFSERKNTVQDLLAALIKAAQRGVDVEVILDQDYGTDKMIKKNIKAFSFLKQNGINVFYDDKKIRSHWKFIIIDEKLVISGSFNWSESALDQNREDGYIIRTKEIVKETIKDYNEIPKISPEPVPGAIPIPIEFMTDFDMASQMIQKRRKIAFKLYLLLNKLSYEQKSHFIEVEESIIFNHFLKGKNFNRQGQLIISYFTNKYFSKRDRKNYPFIKSYENDLKNKIWKVELNKKNTGSPESLWISNLYWKDRWYDRLKETSVFCYFYSLMVTDSGRMGKSFEHYQGLMKAKTKLSVIVFKHGFTELSRFNLMEKNVRADKTLRLPNVYILNDFYVYADFEKAFQNLKNKTDPELFKHAYTICDLTNEPHDLKALKKVISLGEKYGQTILKETIKKIKKRSKGRVTRCTRFAYILAVIRNKGEGIS